jgi:hypothetical protein
MGKMKELSKDEQRKQELEAEKAFRESPLGQSITQLEGAIVGHITELLDAIGIAVPEDKEEAVMTNFIGAAHAAGAIQRLVWQQLDYEQQQKEAPAPVKKAEKALKKQAKKEAVKKNRPRGKTAMKKA